MNREVVTIRTHPVSSFFEPDVLTPYEYFKRFQQKSHFDPEEKLMFAVLTDAIECFQKYLDANAPWRRKLFIEAEVWIFRRDSSWPYSFENICQALNIDPNYLRLGLMQWRVNHGSQKNTSQGIRKTLRYQNTVKPNRVQVSRATAEIKLTVARSGDP